MSNDTSYDKPTDTTRSYDEDREKKNYSWWPLLILPVMFAAGYGLRGAQDSADTTRYGVGGGPGSTPCTSIIPDSAILDGDSLNGEGTTGVGTESL